MRRETSPEEYWASIEQEVREPVLAYALVRLPSANSTTGWLAPAPKWGLAFLTETTLYIDYSSTPNWFQRLLTRGPGSDEQERTAIPVAAMTRVIIPEAKRGLARLLSSPEVAMDIYHHGAPGPVRMLLDRRGSMDARLLERLGEIAKRLETPGDA